MKEKLREKWKTVMLSDVESDVHTEFRSWLFFNEWLEKHGIMRNQFQEPKLH